MDALRLIAGPAQTDEVDGPFRSISFQNLLSRRIHGSAARLLQLEIDETAQGSVLAFIESNWQVVDGCHLRLEPGIGQLGQGGGDTNTELLRLAFLLASLGGEGSFEMRLGAPALIYLGSVALNLEGHLNIDARANRCRVTTTEASGAKRVREWAYTGDQWGDPAVKVSCRFDETEHSFVIAHRDNPIAGQDFLGELSLSASAQSDLLASAGSAIGLIRDYYPEGLKWLQPVLRSIAFIESPKGSSSGSSSSHPGLIFVSYPISPDHLAAQVVHEGAHQYLAIYHHYSPLTDGNPEELYFSPFKGTSRPLYNVLLALHAAVNIRRFTNRLIERGHVTDYIASEDLELKAQIAQMLESAGSAPGLTTCGRELVNRLSTKFDG